MLPRRIERTLARPWIAAVLILSGFKLLIVGVGAVALCGGKNPEREACFGLPTDGWTGWGLTLGSWGTVWLAFALFAMSQPGLRKAMGYY